MRIEELRLTAFGPFTNCTLPLREGLNILYGPNEAGKSSMLRAIHALLFGIHLRTADNFVHAYSQLRVGGTLVTKDGHRLECVRRKGNQATLRDGDDNKQLDKGVLDVFLGAVDEEFFKSVFGIDHERLRAGGEEVVKGEGRIGELLFAAGGISHLREKQQKIANDAGELFKPKAQKPRINSAVSELERLRSEMKELQVSSEEWAAHEEARELYANRVEELRRKIAEDESKVSRLRRIESALPTLAAWKSRTSELDSLEDVVLLPEDAKARFTEANEKLKVAEAGRKGARDRIATLDADLQTLNVPDALLKEQDRVDALYRRLGSHETGVTDRGKLDAQRRAARSNAKRSIEKLGWSISLDDVGAQRLADEKKALVRTLAKRHGEVALKLGSAEKSAARCQRRIAEIEEQLSQSSSIVDAKGLAKGVAAAAAALDLADGLETRRATAEQMRQKAEEALARLPLWSGSLDDVRRLKVPSVETVEQFDEVGRGIEARRTALTDRLAENRTSEERLKGKLAELEKGDAVPTEGELIEARDLRDRGVRLAVETLEGRAVDERAAADFVSQASEGSNLASSLEPSVRRADMVVDRLRREADRVAENSQLVAQLDSLRREAVQLNESIAANQEEQQRYADDWRDRWCETGFSPASPPEMRGWLRQHADLLDLSSQLVAQTDSLRSDEQRCGSLFDTLKAELISRGVEGPQQQSSLQELVEIGQSYVDELKSAGARREQLEKDLKRAREEESQAKEELGDARRALVEWQSSWTEAVAPLQLSGDAVPEQAEAVLANLDQLFLEWDEAKRFGARIYGIDKTAEEFNEAARELALVVAPDLADLAVEDVTTTLNRRVGEARQIEQRKKTLLEQRDQQQKLASEADQELANARAVLDALMTETGSERIEDVLTAIERSDMKRGLHVSLEDLKSRLAPFCGGLSLVDFQTDAESEDPDCLASEISTADERIAGLRSERDEALTARQREASWLERFDGSEAAAEMATERQFLISRLEEDAREYVVACAAGGLLRRAIENYQQRAQGPVLSLAGDRFNKLTCGAFDGLRADFDEAGNEVLVGVRPDGQTTLRVEAMSEGSRDQLYLALRIATLEHWFEQHEPVPFIIDDVLLSFDDARAEAALRTLLELSKLTQVLFFTHHDHLVSLAKKVGEEGKQDGPHVVTGW